MAVKLNVFQNCKNAKSSRVRILAHAVETHESAKFIKYIALVEYYYNNYQIVSPASIHITVTLARECALKQTLCVLDSISDSISDKNSL